MYLIVMIRKVGFFMLDFTWKVFSNTGNVDTYLLFKEIEQEGFETPEAYINEEIQNLDLPIS